MTTWTLKYDLKTVVSRLSYGFDNFSTLEPLWVEKMCVRKRPSKL